MYTHMFCCLTILSLSICCARLNSESMSCIFCKWSASAVAKSDWDCFSSSASLALQWTHRHRRACHLTYYWSISDNHAWYTVVEKEQWKTTNSHTACWLLLVQSMELKVTLPRPKNWAVRRYAHAPFSPKFLMGFCFDGPSKYTDQMWNP